MPGELFRRLVFLVRRDRRAAELEEEMRLHVALRAESLIREGADDREAERMARRRFGNMTGMVEDSRKTWGFSRLDQILGDVRVAVRRLKQRPAFSLPVVGVLALSIGAVTAMFSAVDAVLLRPLPFRDADRLVTLASVQVPFEAEQRFNENEPGRLLRTTDVSDMRDVYAAVAAYAVGAMNLADTERPVRVRAGVVTQSFFSTLGIAPALGRSFTAEEGRPGGPLAVVLSHALWQQQFGGAEVIGRQLSLHERSYAIVGIMPEGFGFPEGSDLWIAMSVPVTMTTFEPFRGFLPSTVVARLQPGISAAHARARTWAAWQRSVAPAEGERRESLQEWLDNVRKADVVTPLRDHLSGKGGQALLVLLAATGLLLLIACANVANLMLSDAAMRRRELAIRGVVGATRGRIARQLLVEAMVLAIAGAALGLVLAPALLRILAAMIPAALIGLAPPGIDTRVLMFAIGVAVATSIVFGLWPALGASRGNVSEVLKSGGGHGATDGRRAGVVRRSLVAMELALAITLLVGAGLMIRSLSRLLSEELGIRPAQVATLETSFPRSVNAAARRRIVADVIQRVSSIPGVSAVGAVNDLPLRGGGGISITIDVPGSSITDWKKSYARNLHASSGYFHALGIALVRGRLFGPSDHPEESVAVIGSTMATVFWPGRDPVGQHFTWRGDTTRIRVIGVVADVREASLATDPQPQMYVRIDKSPPTSVAFVAKGTLPPAQLLARLQDALHAVAPQQPAYNVRMMDEVISNSVRPKRTNTVLIGLFAALALLLAALGVYAVVSYGVARRSREFGIRAALGASGRDLLTLVTREMGGVIAAGITAGLAASWMLSRVLDNQLYEVDVRDPLTFALVPVVLAVPAILATLIPALRAMRVSPTEVMRAD